MKSRFIGSNPSTLFSLSLIGALPDARPVLCGEEARPTTISLESWKRIVDKCVRAKLEKIEMFGGDALLRTDILFPLIRYSVEKGVPGDLTTNGILMNEENSRKTVLAKTGVVYLSIDGVGDVHDSIRGVNGAFSRALSALRNLKAAREAVSPNGGKPQDRHKHHDFETERERDGIAL